MSMPTFQPLVPWPVIGVVALALLALLWWERGRGARRSRVRMSIAVVAVALAALRPGVPGGSAELSVSRLDVYLVVDTTPSMLAEDYGTSSPRLTGVRRDVVALARTYLGARFSVITFDNAARVRLPLSTDLTALEAALSTLDPQPSRSSQGSSVTEARERLASMLGAAQQRQPDRARLVFYLGDGEQTAAGDPEPFVVQPGAIDGGAVLGYGTTEGGPMRELDPFGGRGTYVTDPSTGSRAVSRADETTLRAIAGQLGVPYMHREAGAEISEVTGQVDLDPASVRTADEAARAAARHELFWVPLLVAAAVLAWELGRLAWALFEARPRSRTSPRTSPRTPSRTADTKGARV